MRRLNSFVAVILAPAPLIAFMLITSDGIVPRRPAFVIAAVILAHLFFWIAFFSAKVVFARRKVHAPGASMVLTYGLVFLALSCFASCIAQGLHGEFRWILLVRDSVAISLAGVASYILYLTIARSGNQKSAVSGT